MEGNEGDMLFGVMAYGEHIEHYKENGEIEVPDEAYLPPKCDCANGIHDGKIIDCGCKICH